MRLGGLAECLLLLAAGLYSITSAADMPSKKDLDMDLAMRFCEFTEHLKDCNPTKTTVKDRLRQAVEACLPGECRPKKNASCARQMRPLFAVPACGLIRVHSVRLCLRRQLSRAQNPTLPNATPVLATCTFEAKVDKWRYSHPMSLKLRRHQPRRLLECCTEAAEEDSCWAFLGPFLLDAPLSLDGDLLRFFAHPYCSDESLKRLQKCLAPNSSYHKCALELRHKRNRRQETEAESRERAFIRALNQTAQLNAPSALRIA